MRLRYASLLPLVALAACHRRPRAPEPPAAVPAAVVEVRTVDDAPAANDDLLPGNLNAFGLPMPTVTQERLAVDDMKVFRVDAPMPRVMRYLEQRLEVHDADIHPLAALIHRAIVRGVRSNLIVDVGVRDEGDRTMVTVWNRTPPPAAIAAPITPEQGLRAVGVDPATGQYAPELNR
ncbi:MAG: hypothetical protein JWM10_549 [Myxococcaceae bacterium]|nr:hypothetical protein [Myxococcaceae bacterium]